jgi:hypothetical protein
VAEKVTGEEVTTKMLAAVVVVVRVGLVLVWESSSEGIVWVGSMAATKAVAVMGAAEREKARASVAEAMGLRSSNSQKHFHVFFAGDGDGAVGETAWTEDGGGNAGRCRCGGGMLLNNSV